METGSVRARAVVRGRVQMVGFRAFVERQAHGLRGTVRNLRDGSVEAVVEGPPDEVQRVLHMIGQGPSHARVDAVDVEYLPVHGDLPPMRVTS